MSMFSTLHKNLDAGRSMTLIVLFCHLLTIQDCLFDDSTKDQTNQYLDTEYNSMVPDHGKLLQEQWHLHPGTNYAADH